MTSREMLGEEKYQEVLSWATKYTNNPLDAEKLIENNEWPFSDLPQKDIAAQAVLEYLAENGEYGETFIDFN